MNAWNLPEKHLKKSSCASLPGIFQFRSTSSGGNPVSPQCLGNIGVLFLLLFLPYLARLPHLSCYFWVFSSAEIWLHMDQDSIPWSRSFVGATFQPTRQAGNPGLLPPFFQRKNSLSPPSFSLSPSFVSLPPSGAGYWKVFPLMWNWFLNHHFSLLLLRRRPESDIRRNMASGIKLCPRQPRPLSGPVEPLRHLTLTTESSCESRNGKSVGVSITQAPSNFLAFTEIISIFSCVFTETAA